MSGMPKENCSQMIKTIYGKAITDDGYTALCPECATRFEKKKDLIGRERNVLVKPCASCSPKINTLRKKRSRFL